MQDLAGKVAVVTGAASGIAWRWRKRSPREGMKVALADIQQDALDTAVTSLRQREYDVLGLLTDVSKAETVGALAQGDASGGHHIAAPLHVGLTRRRPFFRA